MFPGVSNVLTRAANREEDMARWLQERSAWVERTVLTGLDVSTLERKVEPTRITREKIRKIKARLEFVKGESYDDFTNTYRSGPQFGRRRSSGEKSLERWGHVGIVEIDGNRSPWIIEASPGGDAGVKRTPYLSWLV
jgi:hypothetical protein